jgi:hypothetical protein
MNREVNRVVKTLRSSLRFFLMLFIVGMKKRWTIASSCLPPSVEQKPTCIAAISGLLYQESIPSVVMPDRLNRASIFYS